MRGDWMDAPLRYDRSYVYRLFEPEEADGRTVVALHGSGADESAILPLARMLAPGARVIAPRGRIMQDGLRRWYRRQSPTRFDQASIRFESEAFVAFLDGLRRDGLFEPERTLFLGYSNGANLVAATMLIEPGRIRQAVLMRSMPVLENPPRADLSLARVLVLTGGADQTYGPFGPRLADLLAANGAIVASDTLRSGHECGEPDIVLAKAWLESIADVPATAEAATKKG